MTVCLGTLEGHLPTPELAEQARRVDAALAEAGYPDLCVSANDKTICVAKSGDHYPHDVVTKAFMVCGITPTLEVP